MNGIQLGFPDIVAKAHTKSREYASPYEKVVSIEQKLRGAGPELDYHEEKRREAMSQLMNKFRDEKDIQQWKSRNGTSVRTIAYDGLRMNMPLNMVVSQSPISESLSGGGLRRENYSLGKQLLSRRAMQLSQQQSEMEGMPTPSMASMEGLMDNRPSAISKGYTTGPSVEEVLPILTPSDKAYEDISLNYDLLLDGLDSGLVGQSSFDYIRRIIAGIQKSATILSGPNVEGLIGLNDDALTLARDIISQKVAREGADETRLRVERALEPALVRISELLDAINGFQILPSDKERTLAIKSALKSAGLEKAEKQKKARKAKIASRVPAKPRVEVARPEEVAR